MLERVGWWLLVGWLAACSPLVPATTPPQLQHTPGAFITITDDRFDGGAFALTVPDGWRVVKTSPAAAPLEAVFVSPDEAMTIRVSLAPLAGGTASADPTLHQRHVVVSASAEVQVYLVGMAPASQAAAFDAIFDRTRASLEFQS